MSESIDREIAERVMGWSLYEYDKGGPSSYYAALIDEDCCPITYSPRAGVYATEFPSVEAAFAWWKPSENIAQAWEVVERMAKLTADGLCNAYWWNFTAGAWTDPHLGKLCIEAPQDVPMAICKAALAAIPAPRRASEGGEG